MAKAGQEGLAIISRAPLEEARTLALPGSRSPDTRALLSGRVATDGGPIWVHTTHLNYRLDDGVAREKQVLAIDDAIRGFGRNNRTRSVMVCISGVNPALPRLLTFAPDFNSMSTNGS